MRAALARTALTRVVAALFAVAALLACPVAHAQETPSDTTTAAATVAPADTLWQVALDSLVVTATRTAQQIEDVAVPLSVVTAEEMAAQGALRLSDVLAEQPGLALFEDHGAGVQMQGFDPDYTLILIDGEPVVGRTAGTLSLDRLPVAGIERVEIVRGPVSSLYGSEALAGVINLITSRPPAGVRGTVRSRYGTHATSDLAATVEGGTERVRARLLLNRYASGGYDLTPGAYGPTTPDFRDYSADLRLRTRPTDRLQLLLGTRVATETQGQAFAATNDAGADVPHTSRQQRTEWSLHPEARLRLTDRLQAEATLYLARYLTETDQTRDADGGVLFADRFDQTFQRAETHVDAAWNGRHRSLAGGGVQREALGGSRYVSELVSGTPSASNVYAFAQHTYAPAGWLPDGLAEVTVSGRLDAHSDFAARLSPNAALLVRPHDAVRLRASVGSGFKAPAFRQLYLAFSNTAAGYDVFGVTRLGEGLTRLEEQGQIAEVFFDPRRGGSGATLQAETSWAFQTGATVTPAPWLDASVNLFRNNVSNLIDTQPVAQKTNGGFIFSYFNLDRIRTQGLEAEVTVRPLLALLDAAPGLALSGGYQRLQARDQEVVDAIEDGTVFGRTADGRDYRLTPADYGGLFGRSKHSGTAKLNWTYAPQALTVTVRGVWRSRYGFRDLDGNGLPNRDDEFVPGFSTWDATVTKRWTIPLGRALTTQLGVDNVFDLRRPTLLPGQPGRTFYASLGWDF
jgi:outer membrane receptor for ferrienterochelin and colicins